MKTFFLSFLGAVAGLFLFFIVLPFVFLSVISANAANADRPPAKMVLELDLREGLNDQPASGGFSGLFEQNSFIDVVQKMHGAAKDDRVAGVFIRSNDFGVGSARAEELREAIKVLRENDKFVVAHTQGMLGLGPSSLRSIAAADTVYLQPGSDMIVTGISFETLFMKDLFDNLSITAEIEQFHEYKNAPNVYKETDFTEFHREAMTELADDLWTISVEDIADDRGFDSAASLKALLEAGPMSDVVALENNIVDALMWPEDAREDALEKAGEGAGFVSVADYEAPYAPVDAPVIALVGGEGGIVTGENSGSLFGGDPVFASDDVAKAILDAGKNDRVKAIVFRVDSPGGSAIASEQIWRAVERVRNDYNKPVVVSMGSVAASGGYYVSAGADAIYALRTTITGSIGVFGGKFAIADGLRRIGINPSSVSAGGDFANAFSTETFSDVQREALRGSLERTYDRFMTVVAEGRDMPEERVRELAKGRVWSGTDAADIDLVTNVGGLMDAIDGAVVLAGFESGTTPRVAPFPTPKDPVEAFGELFGASAESARAAMLLGEVLNDEQLMQLINDARAVQSGQTQMRAPVMIER